MTQRIWAQGGWRSSRPGTPTTAAGPSMFEVPPAPVLPAPSSVLVTARVEGFDLDWSDVPNVLRYEYQLDTANPPASAAVGTGVVSGASVTGLTVADYWFRVRSVNVEGVAGDWSTIRGPHRPLVKGDTLIVPPTQFTVTPGVASLTIDWNDVPANGNFGRYEYRIGTTNPPTGNPVSTGYSSGWTITSLATVQHWFQVRSVNTDNQPGEWSAVQGPHTPLAGSEPQPGTQQRRRIPHPFWTSPLPADMPLAPTSSNYVARLAYQAQMNPNSSPVAYPYGPPWNITLSTGNYSMCIYDMPLDWPRQKIWATDTGKTGLQAMLDKGVPVPNSADLPDGTIAPKGTDGSLIIIQGDELWEFWQWRASTRAGYAWECRQGGHMQNFRKHPGWWAASPWFGGGSNGRVLGYDWGVSACGMSYLGGILTAEDYYADAIRHPLPLALPITGAGSSTPSHILPATRYDQANFTYATNSTADPYRIPEGVRFRLPHSFNIDAWVSQKARSQPDDYGSNADVLRKILTCVRDYGILINESAGVLGYSGEHEKVYGTRYHPYTRAQIPKWGNFGHQIPYSSLVQIAAPTVDISVPADGPA